jgi:hypothetical protein
MSDSGDDTKGQAGGSCGSCGSCFFVSHACSSVATRPDREHEPTHTPGLAR